MRCTRSGGVVTRVMAAASFVTGAARPAGLQRVLAAANRPAVTKPFQLDDLAALAAAVLP